MKTWRVIYRNHIGTFEVKIKAENEKWAKALARWGLPGGPEDQGYPRDTYVSEVDLIG